MAEDYYGILGVNRQSTERDIKQAYRKLARQYHPDLNPGNKASEEKFKKINQAYEVLSDKDKRAKYDQFGDQWQNPEQFRQQRGQPRGTPFRGTAGGGFARSSFGEEDLGSMFEDLFRNYGGSTTYNRPRRPPPSGQDVEHPVQLTLEEAYQGATRTLSFDSGERLEVKIPPGVRNGSRVRIAGKGEHGFGGARGDLYLAVSVIPHPKFERKDDDLYTEVEVPFVDAILGGEVQVETLKGKVLLKIPPDTQNGRIFRLTGQGMPHLGKTTSGDLLAKIKVVLPTHLSEQDKELLRRLKQSHR